MSENNGAVSGYIYDGYTREAYISEQKGMYPAVTFTYRPVLIQNSSVVAAEIIRSDTRKADVIGAALVERQIISWDLSARLTADILDPQPVPIKVSHILRLHPLLFSRIYQIVMGADAGDVKTTDDVPTGEETGVELEKALSGVGPENKEGAEAKN